ncbi:uncharacterized protein ACBT44_005132 isoform 2-T2 [Syngnathus typhle]
MHPQLDAEANGGQASFRDNDDSDSESSQEEPPPTNWNELSIIDRLGLNSVEMSETDLERQFTQIALAFRCDQYTLKQRLQAEEHARNLAEENVLLELSRGRETLEKLELSLDILTGTVERISNTAEVLGAVHQEARVSRAVELMVAHVENVKRRLERHETELEEAKKMIQQQNFRRSIDETGDVDESDNWKKNFLQNGSRRRISVSLIPSDIEPLKKAKRDSKKRRTRGEADPGSKLFSACPSPCLSSASSCSGINKDDNNLMDDSPLDPDEVSAHVPHSEPPPHPSPIPEGLVSCKGGKVPHKSCMPDTTKQRHKSKSSMAKKKTADKEKKRSNVCQRISVEGSPSRQRPLARHRSLMFCVFLLLSFITWIFFFV